MPTRADIAKFESDVKARLKALAKRRESDKRSFLNRADAGAYLTPDILGDRKALTARKKLVMAFGQGAKEFSLKELNQMAAAQSRTEKNFSAKEKGIPIHMVMTKALQEDMRLAKTIKTATLYKISANILDFRVTASGDTPKAPPYYKVRIRLEDFKSAMTGVKAKDYNGAAQKAAAGYVSFDCDCGRYIYWYQYLATIGNFDIEPGETVFPKIRNPKLTGICCKHILKTLVTMQSPIVLGRVASAMQAAAKSKDFEKIETAKLSAKEMKDMEWAGDAANQGNKSAVAKFRQAIQKFAAKQKEEKALAAKDKFKAKNGDKMKAKLKQTEMERDASSAVAKKEIARGRELAAQLEQAKRVSLVNGLKLMKVVGGVNDKGLAAMAGITGVAVDALKAIAKEEGLL